MTRRKRKTPSQWKPIIVMDSNIKTNKTKTIDQSHKLSPYSLIGATEVSVRLDSPIFPQNSKVIIMVLGQNIHSSLLAQELKG